MKAILGIALLLLSLKAAWAQNLQAEVAVLQGLDKITTRIQTIEAVVGEKIRFGSLEIKALACQKHPPEETPESAAYLDIDEINPNEPSHKVFKGWMFASSPALSALQHPVYDIWVIDCGK